MNKTRSIKAKKILLAVSGSIAAYKVCDLIEELRKEGGVVQCVMTKSAQMFIPPLVLRSLTGKRVFTDLFDEYEGVLHTSLADESDLVLIAPASANVIARLSQGMADDLITSVCLAAKAPVLIVPAMNDRMFLHPLTQENIKKLESMGYQFIRPVKGHLVCGREEIGHIPPNKAILDKVYELIG